MNYEFQREPFFFFFFFFFLRPVINMVQYIIIRKFGSGQPKAEKGGGEGGELSPPTIR